MAFKTCPYCDTRWRDFDDFLNDKSLVMKGYDANEEAVENGVIIFLHSTPECGGKIGVRAKKLADIYQVPYHEESRYGTEYCEQHCPNIDDLSECEQACAMRWVRDVMQLIKNRRPSPGVVPRSL